MTGYGGRPGWQDPYGQAPGGWQDPYASNSAYGYGPPGVPARSGNGSTIAALVCNIVLAVTCFGIFAVPGVITAAIAMGRTQSQPESARNLTTWSWVIFGLNLVIVVAIIVVLVVAAANAPSPSPSTGTGGGV